MKTRKRDVLGLGAFVLFWLLPVAYRGLFAKSPPGWPYRLDHLINISCLFTDRMHLWPLDYVEVQSSENGPWQQLPLDEYFTMQPFGYRTRMNEMLNRRLGMPSVLELTAWFRKRHAELHPEAPQIRSIRLVSAFYQVGGKPTGRWTEPPLQSIPESMRFVWFTNTFGPRPAPSPAPQP
jgi:hypothetical protein